MGKFDNIVRNRAKSDAACLHFYYRLFSCNWKINNAERFLENTDCYKIHCFDVNDDVVDVFSSHHHEVSFRKSRVKYDTKDWKLFYRSLKIVYEVEHELFDWLQRLSEINDDFQSQSTMIEQLAKAERELFERFSSNASLNEFDNVALTESGHEYQKH